MAEFSHEADGGIDTWEEIWTGDVEAERICYSYAYNSCCTGGFEIRLSFTDTDGDNSDDKVFNLTGTSDCFRETTESDVTIDGGGRRRLTKIEWRIDDADTECEEGWTFDLKLVMDAVLDYTTSCGGDMDYIELDLT